MLDTKLPGVQRRSWVWGGAAVLALVVAAWIAFPAGAAVPGLAEVQPRTAAPGAKGTDTPSQVATPVADDVAAPDSDAKPDDAAKPAADATPDDEPAVFMRYVDDHKGGGQLQTAIGTYKNDKGQVVHLVAAIHVADKAYYEGLNKTFAGYDAVLYEMVKPKNMGATQPHQESHSMVSMFQNFLKDVLSLDFQLDDIDYTKANFVHADLDAETFAKMEAEHGESIMGLMLQQMMQQMAKNLAGDHADSDMDNVSISDLLGSLNSPDRARIWKRLLAKQFGSVEDQSAGLEGSVLLTGRNKKAIEVLHTELDKGDKDIGIFYGAAHMHDLENRVALMGFHRTGIEWRTAWNIPDPEVAPAPNDDNDDNNN